MCGDSEWGLADAKVACRQLGFPTTQATNLIVNTVPVDTRVIWFWKVRCVGSEISLFNCLSDRTGNNFCFQSDAGVSCQDSKSCLEDFFSVCN